MANVFDKLIPYQYIYDEALDGLQGPDKPIFLSIGTINKIELTKNIKELTFKAVNFVIDDNDANISPYNTKFYNNRNKYIYVLDSNILHCIQLENDITVKFPIKNLRSNHIFIFSYYYSSYHYYKNELNDYTNPPKILVNYITNNNDTENVKMELYAELINNYSSNINKDCEIEDILNNINLILYYDINLDNGNLNRNSVINNYGTILSNIFNLCISFNIKINETLFNEFNKVKLLDINDLLYNMYLNNDNSNYLLLTSFILKENGFKLILKLTTLKIIYYSFITNIDGTYTIEDLYNFYDNRNLYNFWLHDIILDINTDINKIYKNLPNTGNIFNVIQSSLLNGYNIKFKINKNIINSTVIDKILQDLVYINFYNWNSNGYNLINYSGCLSGLEFIIEKEHSDILIKKIKKYNNNSLEHIKIYTKDNKIIENIPDKIIIKNNNLIDNLYSKINYELLNYFQIFLTVGSIIQLKLEKNINEISFEVKNLELDNSNQYIYIYDNNTLHIVQLKNGKITFDINRLSSKNIIIFTYYSLFRDNNLDIKTPYINILFIKKTIDDNYNITIKEIDQEYKYLGKIINRNVFLYCNKHKIKDLLNKLDNIIYYDFNELGELIINENITNYNERFMGIYNLCSSFDIHINDYLMNILMNNLEDFSQLLVISGKLTTYGLELYNKLNNIWIRINPYFDNVRIDINNINIEKLLSIFTFNGTMTLFINNIEKLNNFMVLINTLISEQLKTTIEITDELINSDNIDNILNILSTNNVITFPFLNYTTRFSNCDLRGKTFYIKKKNAEQLLEKIKIHNKGHLRNITFKVEDNDKYIKKLIKELNNDTFKNIEFLDD